jgi:hypothetical protein
MDGHVRSSRPALVADARDLRVAGTLMLGAAASRPLWGPLVGGGVPCALRALSGVPCPLCGMTTSVVATVGFDLGAAVAANPLGVVAVVAVLVLLVRPRVTQVAVPPWLAFSALAGSWGWQLLRHA